MGKEKSQIGMQTNKAMTNNLGSYWNLWNPRYIFI